MCSRMFLGIAVGLTAVKFPGSSSSLSEQNKLTKNKTPTKPPRHLIADREVKLLMGVLYVPAAICLDFLCVCVSWKLDSFDEAEQLSGLLFFALSL